MGQSNNIITNILKHLRASAKDCYFYNNISTQCLSSKQLEAEQQIKHHFKNKFKDLVPEKRHSIPMMLTERGFNEAIDRMEKNIEESK